MILKSGWTPEFFYSFGRTGRARIPRCQGNETGDLRKKYTVVGNYLMVERYHGGINCQISTHIIFTKGPGSFTKLNFGGGA